MAASPSDTSSPLLQPWGLDQPDDDVRPGTALMDARIRELQREQGYTRFFFQPEHHVDDPQAQKARGDTLVQVLFPSSSYVRCDGTVWSHVQFRMSADAILATGSAVFRKKLAMVTPKMRMRRQQDRTGPMLPEDVEYILDLTPPDMDDELAALVSILSVPESVRSWWQSGLRLNIKRSLVCGHDDACPDHQNVPENCQRLPGAAATTTGHQYQESLPVLDLDDIVGPVPSRQIPDYCPIRHRANIIFLMEAVMTGSSASIVDMLDSATRVYTLVKLAKALDCIGVIRDPVFTWALAHPSGNFIELLPEVSLELFWDLKVDAAVRSTFSILVVEGAMELLGLPADSNANATSSTATERAGSTTIFGRKRDRLPDDISNAIQHARDSLTERTRALVAQLKSDSVYDLLSQDDWAGTSIPEWDHLSSIGETLGCTVPGRSAHTAIESSLPVVAARSRDQQLLLDELKTAYEELAYSLVAYFHTQMAESLSTTDFDFSQTNRNRMCYVPRSQFISTSTIYKRLNEEQRLLTTYPWERLKTKADFDSQVNFFFLPVSTNTLAQLSTWLDAILEDSKHIFPELAPYRRKYPDGHDGRAFFRLDAFRTQYVAALDSLRQRRVIHGLEDYEFLCRSQHLTLGLTENELRYLPMWAGGYDDGMGGVYESHIIPNSDNGPSGPGPAFHTDLSVPTEASSIAPSTPTVSGTTTDDDATETAGRSLQADVSSSSSRSTANIYSSQNVSLWESPDFMAESEESDAFDFADSDSDDFPLD
ncbi:uncharacterized protein PG998_004153 [Apiospora kogelbergensis]|uniref:uncharacterized protein n=1 Tax=Apiospora kogelbergensis TaxID=1337665 RepID=UPI00312FAD08